ncbi:MAG: hypothetical protein AAGC97_01360 [Planctomycetota bacterium]
MTASQSHRSELSIDIESIVRGVVRQVCAETHAKVIGGVVSVSTIESLPESTTQVQMDPSAVVTPAALDEMRRRRLSWCSSSTDQPILPSQPFANPAQVGTETDSQRDVWLTSDQTHIDQSAAIAQQLRRRGINLCSSIVAESPDLVRVHVSATPAERVLQFFREGVAAIVISRLNDVPRFTREISRCVFVLDAIHLNLMEMTNCTALLSRVAKNPDALSARGTLI